VKKERVPHLEQHLQWRRRRPPRGAWTPIADVAVSLETPPGRRSEPVCTLSRGRSPRRFTSPPAATPRRAWSTVNWAELWPTRVSACLPPRHFCCSNRLSLSARALRRRGQNRQNAATCTASSSLSLSPLGWQLRRSLSRSLPRPNPSLPLPGRRPHPRHPSQPRRAGAESSPTLRTGEPEEAEAAYPPRGAGRRIRRGLPGGSRPPRRRRDTQVGSSISSTLRLGSGLIY
jgi:hypothetical protein